MSKLLERLGVVGVAFVGLLFTVWFIGTFSDIPVPLLFALPIVVTFTLFTWLDAALGGEDE